MQVVLEGSSKGHPARAFTMESLPHIVFLEAWLGCLYAPLQLLRLQLGSHAWYVIQSFVRRAIEWVKIPQRRVKSLGCYNALDFMIVLLVLSFSIPTTIFNPKLGFLVEQTWESLLVPGSKATVTFYTTTTKSLEEVVIRFFPRGPPG